MADTRQIPSLAYVRACRRAAAFLLHWLDPLDRGEGAAEATKGVDTSEEWLHLACAMARLSWQMVKAADAEGAEGATAYLRSVVTQAALDETGTGPVEED